MPSVAADGKVGDGAGGAEGGGSAILSDGGVGVRSPTTRPNPVMGQAVVRGAVYEDTVSVHSKPNADAEGMLSKTGQHDRPTLNSAINTPDGDAEPEAPTALVAQKSPAPRRHQPPRT